MTLTLSDDTNASAIEVVIFNNDHRVAVEHFETLAEAEAFAEQWIESDPSLHCKIEVGARGSIWVAAGSQA